MTKKQLVKLIAEDTGMTKNLVDTIISKFLDGIKQNVCYGVKVEISQFGIFEAVKRAEREGRDPRTGEPITIPAHFRPAFRPSKDFKEAAKLMEC